VSRRERPQRFLELSLVVVAGCTQGPLSVGRDDICVSRACIPPLSWDPGLCICKEPSSQAGATTEAGSRDSTSAVDVASDSIGPPSVADAGADVVECSQVPHATGQTLNGGCQCEPSWTSCGSSPGCETSISTDPNNCGSCNHVCGSGQCANSDCVRRMFVTSQTYTGGGLLGVAAADANCAALAASAVPPLRGLFKAWIADSHSSPSSTFTHSAAPYVRVDGVRIADNWAGLITGALQNPLDVDENGHAIAIDGSVTGLAWTAVWPDGTFYDAGDCDDWQNFSGYGGAGVIGSTDGYWSVNGSGPFPCEHRSSLYCVEQ